MGRRQPVHRFPLTRQGVKGAKGVSRGPAQVWMRLKTSRRVGRALAFMHLLVPVRGVLLELAVSARSRRDVDDPGEGTQPGAGCDGRTSPIARVIVEWSTPNRQSGTLCVTPCRSRTRAVGSRSTKTSLCFAPAPTASGAEGARQARPGAAGATTGRSPRRVQQPHPATGGPVIRRLRTIAARARVPSYARRGTRPAAQAHTDRRLGQNDR